MAARERYTAPDIIVTLSSVRCNQAAECMRGLPEVFYSQRSSSRKPLRHRDYGCWQRV